MTPLDEAEVRDVARGDRARSPEIEAVAVCLLFSYLNPVHEQRVKEIFAEELPRPAGLDLLRRAAEMEGV